MAMMLECDGAQHIPAALSAGELRNLKCALAPQDVGLAGKRIRDVAPISRWINVQGPIGSVAATVLGPNAKTVRAILFDKNESANWTLGWHQDRTIAVARRHTMPGFGSWTVKDGISHVEPPFEIIERMVTLRVHLDDVGMDNAPLLVSPATHRLGKLAEASIGSVVERHGNFTCLADAGDIWLYRTAILHASGRSTANGRRRVLQLDYSSDELPDPLQWQLSS